MSDLVRQQRLDDLHVENLKLDENVLARIPEAADAMTIHTYGHGASFWTRTACVRLQMTEQTEAKYFLKIATGGRGRDMMEAEYESMKIIHAVTPDFCPEPIAWGTFKTSPDQHFFLCSFHDMDDELPELHQFSACLAKMHRESVSPTGKFGFHITTYNGNIPQDVRWTETWEECFINGTRKDFELEKDARGPSEELEELMVPLFEKVIPRLLRPLETGGRVLKPCFVHGDLWNGNASNDVSTDHPMVFDAAGFYGHNECNQTPPPQNPSHREESALNLSTDDVKAMRISRYQFGRTYMNEYHARFPISAPEEDLDARLALYALRRYRFLRGDQRLRYMLTINDSHLHESTLFVSETKYRQELIDETRKLVEMFPKGLEGHVAQRDAKASVARWSCL